MKIISLLVGPQAEASVIESIEDALAPFEERVLEFAAMRGVKIYPLAIGQKYKEASPTLARLGVDVNAWPVPPAGLFVVEERTVYLRDKGRLTIAHEWGHALDVALGGGVYWSGYDSSIRAAFSAAKAFVTPYAASSIDEYWAESVRAYHDINDAESPWPAATSERLREIDPTMFEIVRERLKYMRSVVLAA